MTAGGKAAHVDTDLGQNCLRSQGLDARDGTYLFDGLRKGAMEASTSRSILATAASRTST